MQLPYRSVLYALFYNAKNKLNLSAVKTHTTIKVLWAKCKPHNQRIKVNEKFIIAIVQSSSTLATF